MSLEPRTFTITRADLVAYAAASGDHNPIHQDESVATAVGLPGVIAHGMYTLALAARAVADWFPGHEVVSLSSKFTAPVVVPADEAPLALSWQPAPLVVWADPVVVPESEADAASLPSIGTPAEVEARAA